MLDLPDSDPRVVAMSSDRVQLRLLFKIIFSSTRTEHYCVDTDEITTGTGSNSQAWTPADDIIMSSVPYAQGREGTSHYTLTFTGNRTEFTGGGHIGIKLGLHLTATTDGMRFTEPLDLYSGVCTHYRLAKDDDRIITEADFQDEMSRIDGSRIMLLTDDAQRRRNPTDDMLEHIDRTDRNIRWGLQ